LPLFLLHWELVSQSGIVNARLFPPPSDVAIATWQWARSGQLWIDLGMSVSRIAVGLTAGAALGVVVGLATGQIPVVANLLG
ncbi:ABC transporter permease, partial [Staphylococcus aureus]